MKVSYPCSADELRCLELTGRVDVDNIGWMSRTGSSRPQEVKSNPSPCRGEVPGEEGVLRAEQRDDEFHLPEPGQPTIVGAVTQWPASHL